MRLLGNEGISQFNYLICQGKQYQSCHYLEKDMESRYLKSGSSNRVLKQVGQRCDHDNGHEYDRADQVVDQIDEGRALCVILCVQS